MQESKSPEVFDKKVARLTLLALGLTLFVAVLGSFMIYVFNHPEQFQAEQVAEIENPPSEGEILDGKDVSSGFIAEGDYQLVKDNCLSCHSSKLILQNRASREGWEEMIRWMQATQKLHDLGESEDKILDYLASYYAPEKEGRRKTLVVDEWYMIE